MKHLLIAALVVSAHCASSAGQARIQGVGVTECGQYLLDRRANNAVATELYAQWASGYISASNMAASLIEVEQSRHAEGATIIAYLDKFCASTPLSSVMVGVINLTEELAGRKTRFPKR